MAARVVVAPDSFKESLTAVEAAAAMAAGVREAAPEAECLRVPMSDGGEGFVETLAASLGARRSSVPVTGPAGTPVTAVYAVEPRSRLAVVEAAQAAGLTLVPPAARDVMRATSRGVGELVRAALGHDVATIVVGLGGTATNDGGAGLLVGLGARLLDARGEPVSPGPAGLAELAQVDLNGLDPRLRGVEVRVASDVGNPLLGEHGASAVFGPQKGARPQDVAALDALLARFAAFADPRGAHTRSPGSGAAGGLGFALRLLGASSSPGVDLVADLVGLGKALEAADLALTGEGSLDAQTLHGKTPLGVARLAARAGVPVIGFAGRLGDGADALLDHGFSALVPIASGPCDLPTALREAPTDLRRAVATAMRLVRLHRQDTGAVAGPR